MKTFRNSKNEEMFTSQGFIEFVVNQKMVPSCRILLFHVKNDQEIVADNMPIDIEDTLGNKVTWVLSFRKFLISNSRGTDFIVQGLRNIKVNHIRFRVTFYMSATAVPDVYRDRKSVV